MLVHLGFYGFVEKVMFVSILTVGLIYAWMKGDSNGCNVAVQRA
jgi:NADH:ubiquinone oxidoreductase subunit 3 (subunit A)